MSRDDEDRRIFERDERLREQHREWKKREEARGRHDKAATYDKMIKASEQRSEAYVKKVSGQASSGGGVCSLVLLVILSSPVVGVAAVTYWA